MLIRPIQTEKAYAAQTKNTYIFSLPGKTSKQSAKTAIEKTHKVTVVSIRTLIRKGKATKFRRGKHAYPGTTHRADRYLAYVTIKSGDKIKVFDDEPTEEAKSAQTKTAIKATDEKQNETVKKAGLFTRRRTGKRGDK